MLSWRPNTVIAAKVTPRVLLRRQGEALQEWAKRAAKAADNSMNSEAAVSPDAYKKRKSAQ